MYGKPHYGGTISQDEILLNIKKIGQTVMHIFKCNPSARPCIRGIILWMYAGRGGFN
jgi:hypothetical protein